MSAAAVIVLLFVLLALRVPVAFALLVPSLIYVGMDDALTVGLAMQRMVSGVDSFPLVAVPLFILLGCAANHAGVTDRLYGAAQSWLGHLRASQGYVNISNSFAFSMMSGTAVSDTAAMGTIQLRAMRKAGYPDGFALGLTGASALAAPIMPPSLPAVIYGVLASVSIGSVFLAGVIPAVLLLVLLAGVVFLYGRRHPELVMPKAGMRERLRATLIALPAFAAPVIIIGGIVGGVFTPTEAAGAGVAYMALLGLFGYRAMTRAGIWDALSSTVRTTGQVMLITAAASAFGFVLARERLPDQIATTLLERTDSAFVFLVLVNVALLLVGMVIEPISALIIMVPVLMPVATSFGVDPVHFGAVVILNLMVGLLTPPVGLVIYVLSSISDLPVPQVVRGVVPFLVPLAVVLVLVTFVPALTLTLPDLFIGSH